MQILFTLKMIARSKTFSQTFYQFLPFTILEFRLFRALQSSSDDPVPSCC